MREGADARWLARHGWHVTAMDVSQVALERARNAEEDVEWLLQDPTATPPTPRAVDLILPLRITPDHASLLGLLDAVASGGTLLFTTHAGIDLHREPAAPAGATGSGTWPCGERTGPGTKDSSSCSLTAAAE